MAGNNRPQSESYQHLPQDFLDHDIRHYKSSLKIAKWLLLVFYAISGFFMLYLFIPFLYMMFVTTLGVLGACIFTVGVSKGMGLLLAGLLMWTFGCELPYMIERHPRRTSVLVLGSLVVGVAIMLGLTVISGGLFSFAVASLLGVGGALATFFMGALVHRVGRVFADDCPGDIEFDSYHSYHWNFCRRSPACEFPLLNNRETVYLYYDKKDTTALFATVVDASGKVKEVNLKVLFDDETGKEKLKELQRIMSKHLTIDKSEIPPPEMVQWELKPETDPVFDRGALLHTLQVHLLSNSHKTIISKVTTDDDVVVNVGAAGILLDSLDGTTSSFPSFSFSSSSNSPAPGSSSSMTNNVGDGYEEDDEVKFDLDLPDWEQLARPPTHSGIG